MFVAKNTVLYGGDVFRAGDMLPDGVPVSLIDHWMALGVIAINPIQSLRNEEPDLPPEPLPENSVDRGPLSDPTDPEVPLPVNPVAIVLPSIEAHAEQLAAEILTPTSGELDAGVLVQPVTPVDPPVDPPTPVQNSAPNTPVDPPTPTKRRR